MNAVSLAGRLAIIMMITMAIAITVSIALSQVIWRSMLYDEGLASCEAAAADLSNVIEDDLELGIPLTALSNTQQLIERALRANTAISDVTVLDDKGVILSTRSLSGLASRLRPPGRHAVAPEQYGRSNGKTGYWAAIPSATVIAGRLVLLSFNILQWARRPAWYKSAQDGPDGSAAAPRCNHCNRWRHQPDRARSDSLVARFAVPDRCRKHAG